MSAMSMMGNEADEITPEIEELARGLQHDPVRIYAYCKNHIQYEHYFGSKKGATLTLLEGKGNAFDISALMVALLRESGYTADYRYGAGDFFDSELSDWWGLLDRDDLSQEPYPHFTDTEFRTWSGTTGDPRDTRTLRFLLQRILFCLNRGFPAAEPTYFGDLWYIPHVWVQVDIGGTLYEMDAAQKFLDVAPTGADIATATGYDRATVLSDAAGSTGTNWVQNLDETAINSRLTTYTTNLLSWIKANRPNDSVEGFLGIRQEFKGTYETLADIPFVYYGFPSWKTSVDTWTSIPSSWMAKLNVTLGQYDYTNKTFTSTEFTGTQNLPGLKGRKVSLSFSGNTGTLDLDDTQWGTASISGSSVDMQLSIDHPHGFYDINTGVFTDDGSSDQSEVKEYLKDDTYAYAIIYGYAPRGRLIRKRQEILDAYIRDGYAATSKEVVTEVLNIMGLNWMLQTQLSGSVIASQFGISQIKHHGFGRMAQEEGFYVDVGLQFLGPESYLSDIPESNLAAQVDTFFSSALEHALIEQLQGTGNEAASTVKVLQLANAQNRKVYRATPSNWASVRSTLSGNGYSADTLDKVEAFIVNDEAEALLPEVEDITLNSWTGTGYAAVSDTSAAMIISGDLMGGYLSTPDYVDYDPILDYGYSDPGYWDTGSTDYTYAAAPITTAKVYGADPVDMATGAFVYKKADLEIGKTTPRGLVFSRSYNSNRRYDKSPGLGYGWTHNLDIYVTERSAIKSALGETTPYHLAPLAAAVAVASDLFRDSTTAKEWQTANLVVKWAIDQMINKGVSVNLGDKTVEFVGMPDGTFIGPAGVNLTLTKNGNLYELSERHGNTYHFDSDNKLETIVDQYGKTSTFTYNPDGTLDEVADCYSRTLTFNWNNGNIERVDDSTGRNVAFTYTGDDLTTATDPDGHDWDFDYDAEHRITELRDPKNQIIVQNIYDTRSRVIEQNSEGDAANKKWKIYYLGQETIEENPEGNQTTYLFDDRGRAIGQIDALGNRYTQRYDGQDHVIESVTPEADFGFFTLGKLFFYDNENNLIEVEDETFETRANVYDAQHRLIASGDFRGNSVEYTYNPQHQVLTIEDAKGVIIQTNTYNNDGELETVTDAGSNTTTYSYDSFGNVNRIDYPDTTFETFVYNARGDLTSHTDRRNHTTSYTYNQRRLLLVTTFPDTSTTINTYDSCGNLATRTDNNGNTTAFTYSATKKLLTTTGPTFSAGTPITSSTYDDRDWLAISYDALGNPTSFVYDDAGRVLQIADPLTRTTLNTYDQNGRQVSTANPENEQTMQTYNLRGDFLTMTDALSQVSLYDYDENGNRTQIENRRNQTYSFTHDPNNRLTSTTTPLNYTSSQTWNNRGLLETIQEPSGQTTTLTYDSMGRVATQVDPLGTITYGYDNSGNLTSIVEGTTSISKSYDNRDRIQSYTDAHGEDIGYEYDANGNLTKLIYPGAKEVVYSYDSGNRLQSVTDWNSRVTSYSYDLKGRLIGISRPNGTTRSIQYDAADQITSVEERKSDGAMLTYFEFGYDDAGRVTSEFVGPLPKPYTPQTYTATYDNDNRLNSLNGNPVFHDNDGNMTVGPLLDDTLRTYSYNARNQLTSVNGTTYVYDAEGNRISQTTSSGTTSYTVDPNRGLSKVLIRTKPDGSKTYYVYGLGLLYEVDDAENTATYHYDRRGSTRFLTADDGTTITDQIEYSPFGLVTYRMGNTDTPFQYIGGYGVPTDSNGLIHMRARYYNPYLRRFLNADPIGFQGGMNWYTYSNNAPAMFTDPTGLWAGVDDAIFAGGGALLGLAGRGVGDLLSGEVSGWEDYVGAAVGGAFAGETLLYTANPVAAGAAAGFFGNASTQGLKIASGKQGSFDVASLAVDTGLGAAFGYIPGPKVQGITVGKGSAVAVFHQMRTKFIREQISTVSPQTATKMFVGIGTKTAFPIGTTAGFVGSDFSNDVRDTYRNSFPDAQANNEIYLDAGVQIGNFGFELSINFEIGNK